MPEVRPDVPPVPVVHRFPAHPASVARARRAVVEVLPEGVPGQLADDICLLTSELVTNAVRYGTPAGTGAGAGTAAGDEDLVELVVWPADGHYWLAVSDQGALGRAPVLACPGAGAEGGRGLLLVDRLAAAWAVRARSVRGVSVVAGLPFGRRG